MSLADRPLGVGLMPLETRWEIIQHVARRGDEWGYSTFGLAETWSYDTTALLSALAGQTQQIKLSAGILSIWGRSAATTAMAAATVHTVSNGRFILGLGASTPQLAEGLHDTSFDKPYSRLRQYITQVRALLNGERIPLMGDKQTRPLGLNLSPRPDLPIHLAATSSKSIRLAGELTDGWIPFLVARDKLSEYLALLHEGAAAADRTGPLAICPSIPTVVADTREEARKGAAWFIAFYIVMMGDVYQNALILQGYQREVEAVLAANQGRRAAIVPPEAEVLLEQLTAYGTPDEIPEQIAAWYEAGATHPAIALNPNLSEEAIDRVLAAAKGISL